LAGEGSSRFLGCAIAKANATSPLAGAFQLQLFGKRTTDGQLFNLLLQVPIVAGEPAVALNQRIRTNLEAAGCTVFDIAIPSFSNPAVTAAGFGIDRYGISTGAFAGSYRVFGVVSLYSAATRAIPKVVGVGWFPTGGFAEYGRGHAASGLEPYARAEGGFAPGDSHDVVLEFGRATLGLCLVAAERAALPLGNGALLLVDPATLVDVVPCHAGPAGSWRRSVAIPPTAAVLGRTLHYQGHGINSTGWVATSGLYSRVWQ
jgi:hypothetical protein